MFRLFIALAAMVVSGFALAQSNRIDIVRADAPELAEFGDYDIGVRTLDVVERDRVDVVDTQRGAENVRYDRGVRCENVVGGMCLVVPLGTVARPEHEGAI